MIIVKGGKFCFWLWPNHALRKHGNLINGSNLILQQVFSLSKWNFLIPLQKKVTKLIQRLQISIKSMQMQESDWIMSWDKKSFNQSRLRLKIRLCMKNWIHFAKSSDIFNLLQCKGREIHKNSINFAFSLLIPCRFQTFLWSLYFFPHSLETFFLIAT